MKKYYQIIFLRYLKIRSGYIPNANKPITDIIAAVYEKSDLYAVVVSLTGS